MRGPFSYMAFDPDTSFSNNLLDRITDYEGEIAANVPALVFWTRPSAGMLTVADSGGNRFVTSLPNLLDSYRTPVGGALTQATADKQPLYVADTGGQGYERLRFDGTVDYMAPASVPTPLGNSASTLLLVVQFAALPAGVTYLLGSTTGTATRAIGLGAGGLFGRYGAVSTTVAAPAGSNTLGRRQAVLLSVGDADGDGNRSAKMSVLGIGSGAPTAPVAPANGSPAIGLGANGANGLSYAAADVEDVMVFNADMTAAGNAAQLAYVTAYLRDVLGVPGL